ncbi:hypothetical protein [Micropruina sonneratiae]|uniref:hypothetical protein n=1 Tax=Micropruina sonneratiae TaxID=2986940 RepID=UPI0022277028|nr:hypothetical protein [Micropruina sp. KQZ13P-5]MCW3159261.1 hypothetical protein [Micropruina sp. KQZ13P-5]
MTASSDASARALNAEWAQMQHRAVPADWPQHPRSLGEVLAGIADDPDAVLGGLLLRNAAGDRLAGRVVLQALLGKLVLLAARDPVHSLGDYLAECWLRLASYPLRRRPRRIAANLVLDTRRAVWSDVAAPPPVDPARLESHGEPSGPGVAGLLRAATRLGLLDREAGACLFAVYGLGLRSHEAAHHLRISADLVRWRNARSIRRLAPHARSLVEVA